MGHVGVIAKALRDCETNKGLDGVRLFGTIFFRQFVPLADRMTKMLEYTDLADPDRVWSVSTSINEVWAWFKMVLKVGNQWASMVKRI